MNTNDPRTESRNWELPSPTVVGLLKLGIVSSQRPVDRLLDRLSLPGGPSWFEWAIAATESVGRDVVSDLHRIARHPVDEAGCTRIKEAGKTILSGTSAIDHGGLHGTLIYMIGVAGALAWHGSMISSQPPSIMEPILMDLAESAPEAWRAFFARAADACARLPGNPPA